MAIDVMNPFHFVNAAHTSLPTFLILSEIVWRENKWWFLDNRQMTMYALKHFI